jgi:hypothetical protein
MHVATHRCGKHISAAVTQHATMEEGVFSVTKLGTNVMRSFNFLQSSYDNMSDGQTCETTVTLAQHTLES